MKFTFVLPSNRVDYFKRTLDSLIETVHNPKNMQILVAVDREDRDKYDISFDPPIEVLLCEKQDGFVPYFNLLLPLVKGDAVWVWSDENIMNTPNWDTIVEKEVKKSKFEDVWYGTPLGFYIKNEGLASSLNPITKKMFTPFPIISKSACDALGCIYPIYPDGASKLRCWGADTMMMMIFEKAERVIPMERLVAVQTEESDSSDSKRMTMYKEDLNRLVERNLAKFNVDDSNIINYDLRVEIGKLRNAMVTPRFYKL